MSIKLGCFADRPEIPEFQYAGLGRMVADFIRSKPPGPIELRVELIDCGRTIVITSGNLTNEITMRYPVRNGIY